MLRVGLVGCGAIGTVLAQAIDNKEAGDAELVAVFDHLSEHSNELANKLKNKPFTATSVEEMLSKKSDLVIEAASQEAVQKYAEKILSSGKNLMIMSVGALVDEELLSRLVGLAEKNKVNIYIPTGAVLGIDALKAAGMGTLKSVTLTTRKSPESLGVDADEERVVFEGSAKEAVKRFPKNINVAATISLAGIGLEKTKVRIIADPEVDKNIHELEAKGDFGEFFCRIKNIPSPMNPKTSAISALSAVRLLKNLSGVLKIGT